MERWQLNNPTSDPAHQGSRWDFLEKEADGFGVVARGMQVLYLNAIARSLVPLRWFGCRCWDIFPVGDAGCASRCPAIKAVSRSQIIYCEEKLYGRGGMPITFGVAVIPVAGRDGSRAVLLLRPKPAGPDDETFREGILARAGQLRGRCEEEAVGTGSGAQGSFLK